MRSQSVFKHVVRMNSQLYYFCFRDCVKRFYSNAIVTYNSYLSLIRSREVKFDSHCLTYWSRFYDNIKSMNNLNKYIQLLQAVKLLHEILVVIKAVYSVLNGFGSSMFSVSNQNTSMRIILHVKGCVCRKKCIYCASHHSAATMA